MKQEDLKREEAVKNLFASEDIIKKGLLTDEMYMYTWSKSKALTSEVLYLISTLVIFRYIDEIKI